jgi:hypothetical protein
VLIFVASSAQLYREAMRGSQCRRGRRTSIGLIMVTRQCSIAA